MALYHTVNGSPVAVNNIVIGEAETQETVIGNNTLSLPDAKANSLTSVVLDGATEQRNLPTEYTQVEYLESSGTQYINTGIVLKSEATITTVGQNVQDSVAAGPYSFWGFMGNISSNQPRWGWSIYQNKWLTDLNATTQQPGTADTNKHTFKNTCYYDNNVLKYDSLLDGNSIFASAQSVQSPSTYTSNTLSAYLFARNNNGTAGNFLSCRIFSYEIVQDGIKVLSLVPCKRNSDSVLGMYDTVSQTFLTNAGTGTFTAGSDAVPTPDVPMDIVCNNGVLKLSPNLFNKNLVPDVNEYINRSNGNASSPSSGEFRHSDFIVIKENTQYYVGVITSTSTSAGLAFYNDAKTYISGMSLTELGNNNNIINSPANTKYIRFSFRTDEGYNTNWQNTVYLVEGTQPLAEFIPYGAIYADGTTETVTDSLSNTATAQRLLKVGTYKDTQEVISGNVTRNVGVKVFDGTENWSTGSAANPNRYTLAAAFNDLADLTDNNIGYSNCYTVISRSTSIQSSLQNNECGWNTTNVFCVRDDRIATLADWKQFLVDQYNAGTPVIVVYPLATATTESVTGQTLTTVQGANTLTATGSTSTLGLSATYTKGTQLKPDYVIRNEKLVFADQGLYLTGPVNYTVVGTPTITDGVLSNTDSSNYVSLDTGLAINSNFEFVIKCRRAAQESRFFSARAPAYIASTSNDNGVIFEIPGNNYSSRIPCANINEWFYIKVSGDGTDLTFSTKLPNESQFAHSTTLSVPSYQNLTILRLGRSGEGYAGGCEIDLKETYIKVNEQLWFYGKNYATQNIAPVPSGYTYGTTTTSAIGFVDMRTQQFTAAPSGVTIGRDV